MLIYCYLGIPSDRTGGNPSAIDHFHGQTVALGTCVAVPTILDAPGIAAAALPRNGSLFFVYFTAPVMRGGQFNCVASYP